MITPRSKLQLAVAAITFGVFAATYMLKDATLFNQVVSLTALAVTAVAYLYGLQLVKSPSPVNLSLGFLIITSLVVRLGAIPIPIFIDDIFYRTLWDGWIQANGVNPYAHLPSSAQLELLKENTLFDLVFRKGHYAYSSPLYEVLYRFLGICYDYVGLAYTILIHKSISIITDIGLIYSLVKLREIKQFPYYYIVAVAWNPFLILFITSQGLFLQLGAIMLIWFFYFLHQNQNAPASAFWGGVMLTSPVGWIGWPLAFIRLFTGKNRWIFLMLSLGTYAAWWLPFLQEDALLHYGIGITGYWVDYIPHLSIGYGLLELVPSFDINLSLVWFIGISAIMLIAALLFPFLRKDCGPVCTGGFLYITMLALFILAPTFLLTIPPVLLILAIYMNRHVEATGMFLCLLMCNFAFWKLSQPVFGAIFTAGLFGLAIYYYQKSRTEAVV